MKFILKNEKQYVLIFHTERFSFKNTFKTTHLHPGQPKMFKSLLLVKCYKYFNKYIILYILLYHLFHMQYRKNCWSILLVKRHVSK